MMSDNSGSFFALAIILSMLAIFAFYYVYACIYTVRATIAMFSTEENYNLTFWDLFVYRYRGWWAFTTITWIIPPINALIGLYLFHVARPRIKKELPNY